MGGAVTQIAKSLGCRVIGINRGPLDPRSPASRRVDAFVAFDDDIVTHVRELDGPADGVDVVFDSVGGVVTGRVVIVP